MKEQGIVGRAELKLAGAAEAFGYDFRGKVVLDIGSSTGGFTEYALRRGAKKVIAIEKGTRQMKAPLRYDKRVELHEKTDFLELGKRRSDDSAEAEELHGGASVGADEPCNEVYSTRNLKKKQGENAGELVTAVQVGAEGWIAELKRVDVVLADVSFVSLTKILAQAKKIVNKKADYLVMLKPQFEARPNQLVNGVVKNERMRREIIQDFELWLRRNGFVVLKKRDNNIVGKRKGNIERFYLARMGL